MVQHIHILPLYRDGKHLIIEPRLGGLGYKETKPLPKVLAEKKYANAVTQLLYTFLSDSSENLCKVMDRAHGNRGKPKKLALTVLMRRLIILANKLLQNPQFSLVAYSLWRTT